MQQLVDNSILGEESLNNLLYGEFVGGLATDESIDSDKKLEFGGYGYNQYNDGTRFAIELVNAVNKQSQPTSSNLTELFSAVRSFGESQTVALMRGPVYPTGKQFKIQRGRNALIPTLRFQPSLLKPWQLLIFAAAVYGIHYIFSAMLPELGASYIGYGLLALAIILVTHNHELCEHLQCEGIGQYCQVEFSDQGPTHRMIKGISRDSHADHVATEIGFSKEDVEKHVAAQNQAINDLKSSD